MKCIFDQKENQEKIKKSASRSSRINRWKKEQPRWNRWPHARVATPLSRAWTKMGSRQTVQETEEGSASPWLSRFSESLIPETPGIERERERKWIWRQTRRSGNSYSRACFRREFEFPDKRVLHFLYYWNCLAVKMKRKSLLFFLLLNFFISARLKC